MFPLVRSLIALALALVACSRSERSEAPAVRTASIPAQRGPDALLLRVPRSGGIARVTRYPDIDSTIWTATDAAPRLERVLAFDPDAGLIAASDSRGRPLWIDLREGGVTLPIKGSLSDIASIDGSAIYGVGSDGAVVRCTPSGNWTYKPPQAARAVFPQANGGLLVLAGRRESSTLWRMRPPENRLLDTLEAGRVSHAVSAPFGGRLYLADNRTMTGVAAQTLNESAGIRFDRAVAAIATTPSGDRFYVVTDSSSTLYVVDRYRDRIAARLNLPGEPRDLRVDPFGRYLLVRAAKGDSVWIVGIGSDRVLGTIRSRWLGDVPFVAPDGAIGATDGRDLVFLDVATSRELQRVADGASDFWYPFVWTGLRARAAALDQPARFPTDSDTAARAPVTPAAPAETTAHPAPSVDTAISGFTVSFAALLAETKAREQAAKIVVQGQTARVVTSVTSGTAIYRVVLGPFRTRAEADQVGRASGMSYVVYPGTP
jgi:DNA-binding beta-propeller fold protein YncE